MTTTPEAEGIEEEMTTWEAQLAQAILGALEHRGFNDCGKYIDPTLIEHIRPLFNHQLHKARQDWLREEIVRLEGILDSKQYADISPFDHAEVVRVEALQTIIDRYQAELDQPIS